MNWKLKCLLMHTIARVPTIHSRLKKLSGRYFFTVTPQELEAYNFHIRNFKGGRALEFGAGSNLLCPLLLSRAGASEVIAIDLDRIATLEQVNHVIRQLGMTEVRDLDSDLIAKHRIRYLAPADARATGLEAGSIDFICSTSTLEHIPPDQIRAILKECKRIAADQAVFSFIIDYHDHYATADISIDKSHFYRYSDAIWRLFNPANHYQNRLRHSDFERLFVECGLANIESRAVDHDVTIDRAAMHERFRAYTDADLVAMNGFFVLHR